jgi:hypothetical protein
MPLKSILFTYLPLKITHSLHCHRFVIFVPRMPLPLHLQKTPLPTVLTELGMKTDGNGRKNPISTSVSIFFLAETGAGSENAGSKTESEYADIQKRTNTDGEPEN